MPITRRSRSSITNRGGRVTSCSHGLPMSAIMSMATSRKWKVINPTVKNSLGEPTGYILFPGENAVPYAAPTSSVRKRAGFINAHLWATPYNPDERFAGGDYINQSAGGDGLPKWTAA